MTKQQQQQKENCRGFKRGRNNKLMRWHKSTFKFVRQKLSQVPQVPSDTYQASAALTAWQWGKSKVHCSGGLRASTKRPQPFLNFPCTLTEKPRVSRVDPVTYPPCQPSAQHLHRPSSYFQQPGWEEQDSARPLDWPSLCTPVGWTQDALVRPLLLLPRQWTGTAHTIQAACKTWCQSWGWPQGMQCLCHHLGHHWPTVTCDLGSQTGIPSLHLGLWLNGEILPVPSFPFSLKSAAPNRGRTTRTVNQSSIEI